jgi:hypothetical protein
MTPDDMRVLRNEMVDVLIEHWDRVVACSTDPVKTDSLVLTVLMEDDEEPVREMYLSIKLEEAPE